MHKLLIGCFVAALLATVAAQASARSVTFTLPSQADAGAPVAFTFTAQGLRRTDRMVLQQQLGTRRVWRTTKHLPRAASGSGTLKALPKGKYQFRIAMLNSRGNILSARRRDVTVFGQVALAALVGREPQSTTTPTRTFSYVLSNSASTVSHILFAGRTNFCRSVHLDFLSYTYRDNAPNGILTVVQESMNPVSVSTPNNTIGLLDAPLVPGETWSINISTEVGGTDVFVNGTGSCYKAAPLR